MRKIVLPVISLFFSIIFITIYLIRMNNEMITGVISYFMGLALLAGVFLAIISISQGKNHIGKIGIAISILSIIIAISPFIVVVTFIIFWFAKGSPGA